jgi:hypothetical protein
MPAAYEAADLQRIFGRMTDRMRAIEEQLALLSEKAGVPYDKPGDDAPPEVVELARAGKQLEAIKKYRELTGADFDTARTVVGGL